MKDMTLSFEVMMLGADDSLSESRFSLSTEYKGKSEDIKKKLAEGCIIGKFAFSEFLIKPDELIDLLKTFSIMIRQDVAIDINKVRMRIEDLGGSHE